MHSRPPLTIVLLAILGLFIQIHGDPPPFSSKLLKLAGPDEGAIYTVHDPVHIKKIELIIQKRISMPELNKPITTITAQDLYATSEFIFEAKKEYIIDQQKSIPYRVRASWDGGYSDSNGFFIKE
ncbi:hypothetical protein BG005_007642 [Podila minutissima]|nr:hypothetical protein BG005_007642 [Podila minutissima]